MRTHSETETEKARTESLVGFFRVLLEWRAQTQSTSLTPTHGGETDLHEGE